MALDPHAGQKTANITIVAANGEVRQVQAEIGKTLMEVAVEHGVPGLDAICGGSCACATCHVIVDPAWFEHVGPPSAMEVGTLYFGAPRRPTSRLSCQMVVTKSLDGLRVEVAT